MTELRLRRMEIEEIEALIRKHLICRVAFKSEPFPYVAPFQYAVLDDTLYFHLTDYGRKMRLLEKDNRVCVEIEGYASDFSEYSFVVLRGTLEFVDDAAEKERAIKKIAEAGAKTLSDNFLAVHGLQREEGWSSLPQKRPLHIARLQVDERMGLRSPYAR